MSRWIVMDDSPIDEDKEMKRQKDWIEHCRKHQADALLPYKEILKPSAFAKLSKYISQENERRLASDKYRYDGKFVSISDAL